MDKTNGTIQTRLLGLVTRITPGYYRNGLEGGWGGGVRMAARITWRIRLFGETKHPKNNLEPLPARTREQPTFATPTVGRELLNSIYTARHVLNRSRGYVDVHRSRWARSGRSLFLAVAKVICWEYWTHAVSWCTPKVFLVTMQLRVWLDFETATLKTASAS